MRWVKLGDYIELYDKKNVDDIDYPIIGINKDKAFMPTVANTDGVDKKKYKIVQKGIFVFSGMQTGRDECIRISLYEEEKTAIISPAYTTFTIRENSELIPEFVFLYFLRPEMDRYGWFISDSSVRSNLDWPRFLEIEIPLPSIEKQKEVVEAWKGLKNLKEQNEQLAQPLMDLCQSYLVELKKKYPPVELGGYIELSDLRNSLNVYNVNDLKGVTSNSEFDTSKANTDGLSFNNYKIVKKDYFAYNPSRINLGSIALNRKNDCIISPMYIVFKISDEYKNLLLSEFLMLWFTRSEFQRSTLFFASGSVRDTFSFDEMKRIKLPLPPIEVQQTIVNIYNCAKEAKEIANKAELLIKDICPALMRQVIGEN